MGNAHFKGHLIDEQRYFLEVSRYPTTAVAAALGYRDYAGVGRACGRIEHGTAELQRIAERLEKLLNP